MHIQIQVDYGVRALIDLAEHAGEGSIHTSEIARRKGIPEPYLARVLHSLSQHGFTASQRGPTGGHVLALPPNEITMGMVMDRLGGPQRLMGCLDNTKPSLEILADDVQCFHGATAGSIPEEALFYMRSRGIDREAALRLLIQGFASEIIDVVTLEPLRDYLNNSFLHSLRT